MREATFVISTAIAVALANIMSAKMGFIYDFFCNNVCSNLQLKTLFATSSLIFFAATFIIIYQITTKLIPQNFEPKNGKQ